MKAIVPVITGNTTFNITPPCLLPGIAGNLLGACSVIITPLAQEAIYHQWFIPRSKKRRIRKKCKKLYSTTTYEPTCYYTGNNT